MKKRSNIGPSGTYLSHPATRCNKKACGKISGYVVKKLLAHIRPFEMCDIKMPEKDRKGPSLSLKPGTFTGFPYSSLPFKDKSGHRVTFYPNYNSRKVTARPRKVMVRETILWNGYPFKSSGELLHFKCKSMIVSLPGL